MFFNLFTLIFLYSFFFILIFISGKFSNKYIFNFKELSFGETGIVGFLSIYFLILTTHFVFPINDYFIYSIYFLLILFLLFNFKQFFQLKKISKFKFIVIFLIFLILSITNNHHDDLYIFQLPIINYMQNYKIIFGLINLNDFIGQGHSFYEIMSFFKFPFYENTAYFLLPIIFLNFFVIYLFECIEKEKNYLIKYFIYFIIILLIVRFNRSKEYGTDIPLLCLLFYIQINFFKYLYTKELDLFLKSIVASLFCIILKLYGITSLFYLIAFLPILKRDLFKIFNKKKLFFFLITIFVLTMIKNVITSGCLFYPIHQTCIDKQSANWSIGKEVARDRNKFYNAQVMGWRSYTKNINNREFISAEEYLSKNILEKIKGLSADKDIEKILTGLILVLLFIVASLFSKNKITKNKLNRYPNIIILSCLVFPIFFWLLNFPQSRYGYFSYISCFAFFISFQFLKVGEISKKFVIGTLSVFLVFLIYKNFNRIIIEVKRDNFITNNYPIKKFRYDDYEVNLINNVKVNVPINSFMECANIPMLCAANKLMINNIKIKYNYYFLENNELELKKHIKLSAVYDMIETNN